MLSRWKRPHQAWLALMFWLIAVLPGFAMTTLTFWDTMGPEEQGTLKQLINTYEAANPNVRIKLDAVPFADAQAKFEFAATANVAPDILRCEIAWTPLYADLGFLLPLETLVNRAELADFLAAPLFYTLYGGHLWGIPQVTDCLAIFYNRRLLKAALTESPGQGGMPDTWRTYDDFVQTAKTVQVAQKKRGPDYWALFFRGDSYFVQPWIWLFGGGLISEAGEILISSPESVAGLKAFLALKDEHRLAPTEVDFANDYDNAMKGFKSGKYAMIVNGPWAVADVLTGDEFNAAKGGDPAHFGVAVIPPHKGHGSPVGGHNYVLSRNCRDPQAALAFIAFLSRPENQAEFAVRNFLLPTRKSTYALLAQRNFPGKEIILAFEKQLKLATNRPVIPEGGKLYADFSRYFQKAYRGEMTPEDALNRVADEWKKLLAGKTDVK
jgi:arabinogalactan oligomer/maltooligosaccharide transport system substrate-binding protein